MNILGINAFHSDASACIIKDGILIAACEEERFKRIKHFSGTPVESVKYCLEEAGLELAEVHHISISRNPVSHMRKKLLYTLLKRPDFRLIINRIFLIIKAKRVVESLCDHLNLRRDHIKAKTNYIEHHKAHMASSFFVSPFNKASILSIDSFGDFVSMMTGVGSNNRIKFFSHVNFPHSLGILYTAATQFLGFREFGDEYKVMGLAAYGEPEYAEIFRRMITLSEKGDFRLEREYFTHSTKLSEMKWNEGTPVSPRLFSDKWNQILGPARLNDEDIERRHKNIACSVQAVMEEVYFHVLNKLYQRTGISNLCLCGGVALNSLANGKIKERTPYKKIYIQPAAGDAGTAIGAAYYTFNQLFGGPRKFTMDNAYLGPEFGDQYITDLIMRKKPLLENKGFDLKKLSEQEICSYTAKAIFDHKIIGWFQGRMEWGPRALGNRSILCNPGVSQIRDILNLKIKKRESFRPFATSIHLNALGEYFETDSPDPFMLMVYKIKSKKRELLPAVVHIDGTSRVQTVSREVNPMFWQLIDDFRKLSGIPALLNTSFNENEPVVCKPEEGIDCFLRTDMDLLVLGNWLIERKRLSGN